MDELTFTPVPQWRCLIHGPTRQVVHFMLPGTQVTYCMTCFMILLERLGMRSLERIEFDCERRLS